ncbi:hypothetical protein WDV06_30610 [Streptomyces racemochromogenes]|uniref:ABC transporter permease n=1 Tax=Streptomyces racemochromogenes TaxID=67353 RepID=A0ABW7PLY3_9ACTN
MTDAVTPPLPPPPPSDGLPDQEPAVTPADIRDGAAVALLVGVSGALLALLWVWLAPRVQYVANGPAVFLKNTEGESRIGADGTFFLLSLGLGALSALAVFLWRRRGGVALVVGLTVGACFAALLGWRMGLWLGPGSDIAAAAAKAGQGVPFDAPMQLLAYGVLLGWPMAAAFVHLCLTAAFGPRDPAPDAPPEGTYPPPHVHADARPPQG